MPLTIFMNQVGFLADLQSSEKNHILCLRRISHITFEKALDWKCVKEDPEAIGVDGKQRLQEPI